MWNSRSLLKACEKQLAAPATTLQLRRIADSTAHVEYDFGDGQVLITIDPAQSSLVEGCLHELLHIVLLRELEPFNELIEEKLVRALERHLWVDVMKKADVSRWRKLIKAKLT